MWQIFGKTYQNLVTSPIFGKIYQKKKPYINGLRVLVTSRELEAQGLGWEWQKKRSSGAGPYFLLNMEVLILEVSGKSLALVQLHRGVSESGVNSVP